MVPILTRVVFTRVAFPIGVITATAALGAGGCKADLPMQLAQDGSGDLPCSEYADQLVTFTNANGEVNSELGAKALGAPDEDTLSLPTNGVLTVGFIGLGGVIQDEDTNMTDIKVHGSLDGGQVAVFIGGSPDNLEASGFLNGETLEIELGNALQRVALYVQLTGISGSATIDALESLQTRCGN